MRLRRDSMMVPEQGQRRTRGPLVYARGPWGRGGPCAVDHSSTGNLSCRAYEKLPCRMGSWWHDAPTNVR